VRFWGGAAEPVDVLVVCTGNLCRSPIMQTLVAAAAPSITVRSAGTSAPRGHAWHPLAMEVLAEAGHEVSGQARRLSKSDVSGAALILTAEGLHRGRVVQLDATAEERCFTLLEAARLLQLAPAPRGIGAEALAAHLAAALRDNPLEHDDDLPDPIAGTIENFRGCRNRVAKAVRDIGLALQEPEQR
jgi:protein-tyrosine phosphatase